MSAASEPAMETAEILHQLGRHTGNSSDLCPAELLDDIKEAYGDDLVDPGYIGFDDAQRNLAMGKDGVLARLADDPHRRLVEDTVKETGWWTCFREDP